MKRAYPWWVKPVSFAAVWFLGRWLIPPRRSFGQSVLIGLLMLAVGLPVAYAVEHRRRKAVMEEMRRYGPGTGRRNPTVRR